MNVVVWCVGVGRVWLLLSVVRCGSVSCVVVVSWVFDSPCFVLTSLLRSCCLFPHGGSDLGGELAAVEA